MTTDEERAAGPFRQLAPWVFFVPDLVCGRILQGFATGTVVGAVGAAMIDVNRSAGTLANAVTPPAGTAVGAMGSGLLVSTAP